MSIGYSMTEQALLDLLRKKKHLTAQEATSLYYGKGEAPFYAEQTIRSALARLQKKAEFNREPFTITSEKKAGQPIAFVFSQKARIRA
jgi:hypothetical protein